MTWTYSGDPSKTDLDLYRFTISDTDSTDGILQDEEINFILIKYSDENERLYSLYDKAAQIFARKISRRLGPESEDTADRLAYFKERAEYYRQRTIKSHGLSQPKSTDTIFYKGMHDNVYFP